MAFTVSKLQLVSPAFEMGGKIPVEYTRYGDNISPALEWTNVPEGTCSFALICHDPDAPLVSANTYGVVHWVLYNIPGSITGLPKGVTEYTRGLNTHNKEGYIGPMPPEGHGTHHYFFVLLALNKELNLEADLTMWQLLERIEPNVIGVNRLVGIHQR